MVGDKAKSLKRKERHNLYALSGLLDEGEKEKLNQVSNGRGFTLERLLKSIGDGFVFWRYPHEDGNEDFGGDQPFLETETFLESYLPCLNKMAHQRQSR